MPTFAGFTLPDELRLIREQIRRFIREEIIPLEQRLDPDAPSLPEEDWERLASKTKAAGLWALAAPEEYGGGGLDTFSMCVVYEEMAQHRMGLYNIGCGVFGRYPPPAIWAGSRAQIEKYAVPTIREGWRTFFAITEPSGGSDPANAIQTRAERRGDTWALIGQDGQGLDLAFDLLVKNRFPYSATNLGVAVAAHRMAIEHAKHRSTFGAPLSQRQAIQWMLADAEVELRACRWIIWEGAWK